MNTLKQWIQKKLDTLNKYAQSSGGNECMIGKISALEDVLYEMKMREELPQNTEEKPADCLGPLGEDHHYQYILEKLRAEFTERRNKHEQKAGEVDYEEMRFIAGKIYEDIRILDLLTSLEQSQTKEEPTRKVHKITDEDLENMKKGHHIPLFDTVWTPTPGEMIEVSNDGEKWEKKEFVHTGRGIALADKTIYFYTTGLDPDYDDGRKLGEGWKYARPIKEEVPSLPDFKAEYVINPETAFEYSVSLETTAKQVEALTASHNALIAKFNKR